jgi:molecular chaperone DnaK
VSWKRLRVRLKAIDPDTLADTFGANLSATGLFLKSAQLLPAGTKIALELLYSNGTRALSGNGKVESVEDSGMHLAIEWADDSVHLAQWLIERHAPESIDPYEDVTVLAADDFDDAGEEPTVPNLPLKPPPIQPPAPLVQQRAGSDAWDLISDLIDLPPPPMPPAPDLAAWSGTAYSHTDAAREPGEVTPLARIELVAKKPDPLRTGDIEPLDIPDEPAPKPRSTAIPSKRSPSKIGSPSDGVMAIDFGTVHTRAAVPVRDEAPRMIDSRRGTDSTPSIVMIRETGKTIVGEPALRKLTFHPRDAVFDVRRLLGLPFASERLRGVQPFWCELVPGEDGEAAVRVGPYEVSIEEIAALMLKEVRESALLALEQRLNRAVITCPASFGFRQREALRVSARLAGIWVERMISEPVAAAIHAMNERAHQGRVFVYRLGGGTFDATIVLAEQDRYEVLASESELFLGGVDFDAALGAMLADEIARLTGASPRRDPSAMAAVMEAARKAKHQLTTQPKATVFVESPAGADASFQIEVEVSRDRAEKVWAPLFDRTVVVAERALAAAGLEAADIDHLVLAGGPTRMPTVEQRVKQLFGRDPFDIDPERAAVLGAAILAGRGDGGREIEIRDVLGTSLFVTERGAPPTLTLMRGSPLPATAVHTVRAQKKNSPLEVVVAEGPAEDSTETIGAMRIDPFSGSAELRFDVSTDGLLSVSAMELETHRPLKAELIGSASVNAGKLLGRVQSAAEK